MLEVITPATNFKLTTLTAAKALLPDADETLLTSLIERVSSWLAGQCGRVFAQQEYKETLAGYGGVRLLLSRTPIVSVSAVTCNGDPVLDYLIEDPRAGILYRAASWTWSPTQWWNIEIHPMSGSETLNFVVQYIAGYVLPGDTERTLPEEVEAACLEMIKFFFNSRERDPFLTSERLGDYQVSYSFELPRIVQDIIRRYSLTP